jgi:cytochrome P450/phosphatidylglycerophosphate synthase
MAEEEEVSAVAVGAGDQSTMLVLLTTVVFGMVILSIFRRRNLPAVSFPQQPKGKHWLWGHGPRLPRDGTHIDVTLMEMSKEMNYADVFTLKVPVIQQMVIVANPDLIHYITVSKNIHKSWTYEFATIFNKTSILRTHGDVWKQQRKTFVGGFTPTYLREMVVVMCEKLDRLLNSLDLDAAASQQTITTKMLRKTQIFASDIIAQIGFGEDWGNAYLLEEEERESDSHSDSGPVSITENSNSRRGNWLSTTTIKDFLPIPLYVPNLLGYARIILSFWGLAIAQSHPVRCTVIWVISASLDLFDGMLARLLNQTSSLGVLLDIAADNILRTAFWMAAIMASSSRSTIAPLTSTTTTTTFMTPSAVLITSCCLVSLEWFTMVCTQLHSKAGGDDGTHWKACRQNDPKFIQLIFANNFRSPLGVLCIYGLFTSGFVVYASHYSVLVEMIPFFNILLCLAVIGRLITMVAEIWLCSGYLSMVIAQDSKQQTNMRRKTEVNTPDGNVNIGATESNEFNNTHDRSGRSGEDITNGRAVISEMSALADQRLKSPLTMFFGSRRLDELTDKLNNLMLGVLDRRLAEINDNSIGKKQTPKDICSLAIASIRGETKTEHLNLDQKLEIIEQLKTFYFAGHDTTATTIAWAAWLLSQHPQVVSKLRQELDEHGIFSDLNMEEANSLSLASKNAPTYEQLNSCPYLDAVVKETLRLYPPAGSARYTADANESYRGMRLGGAVLYVCPYVLHRLPQYWERPDDFWPERFVDVSPETYANKFLPFSKGPRDCLGKYFASLEAKLAIAALAQRYDMACVDPNEKVGVQITAFPKNGAQVNVSLRT